MPTLAPKGCGAGCIAARVAGAGRPTQQVGRRAGAPLVGRGRGERLEQPQVGAGLRVPLHAEPERPPGARSPPAARHRRSAGRPTRGGSGPPGGDGRADRDGVAEDQASLVPGRPSPRRCPRIRRARGSGVVTDLVRDVLEQARRRPGPP